MKRYLATSQALCKCNEFLKLNQSLGGGVVIPALNSIVINADAGYNTPHAPNNNFAKTKRACAGKPGDECLLARVIKNNVER